VSSFPWKFGLTVSITVLSSGKMLAQPSISEYLRYHDSCIGDLKSDISVLATKENLEAEVAQLRHDAQETSSKV
jgi:hypothetical protein